MIEELEFRGIHRKDILIYFQEMGGIVSEERDDVTLIHHDDWKAEVQQETFFEFMHSKIPVVKLTVEGVSEETHQLVLKKLRLKTFRAGG